MPERRCHGPPFEFYPNDVKDSVSSDTDPSEKTKASLIAAQPNPSSNPRLCLDNGVFGDDRDNIGSFGRPSHLLVEPAEQACSGCGPSNSSMASSPRPSDAPIAANTIDS